MKNPNHIFWRRHIHIGYNPLEDDRDHPLKGVSGYLVDVSEMSIAGYDAVFVPDMGLEEFKIKTNSVDDFDELYHLCDRHFWECSDHARESVLNYIWKVMPIHRSNAHGAVPCIEVNYDEELELYTEFNRVTRSVHDEELDVFDLLIDSKKQENATKPDRVVTKYQDLPDGDRRCYTYGTYPDFVSHKWMMDNVPWYFMQVTEVQSKYVKSELEMKISLLENKGKIKSPIHN